MTALDQLHCELKALGRWTGSFQDAVTGGVLSGRGIDALDWCATSSKAVDLTSESGSGKCKLFKAGCSFPRRAPAFYRQKCKLPCQFMLESNHILSSLACMKLREIDVCC